jgi:hypothetical protein
MPPWAFLDDDTVVAVGRDVNSGPALLSLSVGDAGLSA